MKNKIKKKKKKYKKLKYKQGMKKQIQFLMINNLLIKILYKSRNIAPEDLFQKKIGYFKETLDMRMIFKLI